MRTNGVRYLLMGGQACVLYGAAEFSRDTDLTVLADAENLRRLQNALAQLDAERIAVPPFAQQYLDLGLAVHFRCRHPQAAGQRIDVMSTMRGVAEFPVLWERRTTIETAGQTIELLSLPDLVQAKKTQRDKDWPMLTRLVEANYQQNWANPTAEHIAFWLKELRTSELLLEVAHRFPDRCQQFVSKRPLLANAVSHDLAALSESLRTEELHERQADREYWRPLRAELERLRHSTRDS
jgi:hypothetical protein